jgi:hypothetical protein
MEKIMKEILEQHTHQKPIDMMQDRGEGWIPIQYNTVLYEVKGRRFIVKDKYGGSFIREIK